MIEDGQPEALGSLRERLAETLPPDVAEVLWEALRESLSARKLIWTTCGKCGKRTEVEVRDPIAATRAAAILLEQLEGRPGVAAGDAGGEPSVLVKLIYAGMDGAPTTEDAERWAALLEAGALERLGAELAEAAMSASERGC